MSKPYIHAQDSVTKFGGCIKDYIEIHNWFDSSKAIIPDHRHRALYHHSQGIFLCERIFGFVITNSDGKVVSVRDIGEQHVLSDFGGKFIPTAQDYLQEIELKDWMSNGEGQPPISNMKVSIKIKISEPQTLESSPILITPYPNLPQGIFFDGSKPSWNDVILASPANPLESSGGYRGPINVITD